MIFRILLFLALAAGVCAQWKDPFPAHRVIGNVYYVGTADLACYLITSPQGHILINTALADSVPLLQKSVESLGFQMKDIKVLLTMQAHFDHVAAMAEVKQLTGAQVYATAPDASLLEDGGKSDFVLKGAQYEFAPVKVERRLKDGEEIRLGSTRLKVYLHPGHTRGSSSYALTVDEGGKRYRVLIANMGTINPGTKLKNNEEYPRIADDLRATYAAQKKLDCDVFLSAHASQYGLKGKYRPGQPYSPETFVDPAGFRKAVAAAERNFLELLAAE